MTKPGQPAAISCRLTTQLGNSECKDEKQSLHGCKGQDILAGVALRPDHDELNLVDNFDAIYERYYQNVYRAVRAVVLDPPTAEDLTQDAFVQAYRKRHQYLEQGKLQSYLCTVGVRTALSYLRWHKLQDRVSIRLKLFPAKESVDFESATVVGTALKQVTPEMRAAIVLSYHHGFSYKEIGEILQIPEGTVGSRINRGLEIMRRFLGEGNGGEVR